MPRLRRLHPCSGPKARYSLFHVYFKQFYLGCLAHASYLIGDGERRRSSTRGATSTSTWTRRARRGSTIKWVVETHLHADFVSGHRELAARTGATIVMGEKARAAFPHRAVRDGDEIRVGRVVLRFLETPGHTPESISILVLDPGPRLVLTGDTLFIGDVGRPDLAASPGGLTPQDMAAALYESLHGKLLALPDDVAVYPAHGAGSLCGRNISERHVLHDRRPAPHELRPSADGEGGVRRAHDRGPPGGPRLLPARCRAEPRGRRAARRARPGRSLSRDREASRGSGRDAPRRASSRRVRNRAPRGCRQCGPHGTVRVLDGIPSLARPPGRPRPPEDTAQAAEAAMRLARVGLENVAGYLDGGVVAWDRAGYPMARLDQIDVAELEARRKEDPTLTVLDVRRPGEYGAGHVPGAVPLPLDRLGRELDTLQVRGRIAIICASGYRSSVAGSLLLRKKGVEPINVVGGTNAWVAAGYPTE